MTQAHLSVITSEKPERISKGFRMSDGRLEKLPGGNLIRGTVKVRAIDSLDDLARLLSGLTPAQALAYGIPPEGTSVILTRKEFEARGQPAGYTSRTNDRFSWPDGAGVLMIDYDPSKDGEVLDRVALVDRIRSAAPGLADATMLWLPSASSCIWYEGAELSGIKGQRLWIMVANASDIARAGSVLADRLWLAGHGWYEISKSGSLLPCTLVDASVWQPSRLDFAGGAACSGALKQRRGDPVQIGNGTEIVDTVSSLPDLTADEKERLAQIQRQAKAVKQGEAEAVRNSWVGARVREMTEKTGDAPEALTRAEAAAHQALDEQKLADDFILHVEIDGAVKPVSVHELLDDPARWNEKHCRDPVEPDYDGGRLVGKIYLMRPQPSVHSFARGGAVYHLHMEPRDIVLDPGKTDAATDATIELLQSDPLSFDFGEQLATVSRGKTYQLDLDAASYHVARIARYKRLDARSRAYQPVDPPTQMLRQVLAFGVRRRLKPLKAVITAPTIRLDGTILDRSGYDVHTGLLVDIPYSEAPLVIEHPTLEQARDALDALMKPFAEFPFVNAGARGCLLAALLTAAVRSVLPTSPAFGFDAPVQGSGKTLLAQCIGALVEGREPDIWPHTSSGRDDEEARKRLFTALRSGTKALIWDNIVGEFDSPSMASLITATTMTDRILGRSEAVSVPARALLVLTGNNLMLSGDLPRRVLLCRIDPRTSEPFAREFDLDPLAHCFDHRVEMIAAACPLIRARFTQVTALSPGKLASFEDWDNLVHQTVVWCDTVLDPAGFGDPMDLIREAQAADPEADALLQLLDALRKQFGGKEFPARAMHKVMNSHNDFSIANALEEVAGDNTNRTPVRIGRILRARQGRIVYGLRLESRMNKGRGAKVYRIMSDKAGITGIAGIPPAPRENCHGDSFAKDGRTAPPTPSTPPRPAIDADVFDPEAWV